MYKSVKIGNTEFFIDGWEVGWTTQTGSEFDTTWFDPIDIFVYLIGFIGLGLAIYALIETTSF